MSVGGCEGGGGWLGGRLAGVDGGLNGSNGQSNDWPNFTFDLKLQRGPLLEPPLCWLAPALAAESGASPGNSTDLPRIQPRILPRIKPKVLPRIGRSLIRTDPHVPRLLEYQESHRNPKPF